MEQRKDIYLVFKECLNNIIKHAAAKNVSIRIDTQRNGIDLKIEDDGKGFNHGEETDRNGVKNMQARVRKWKGRFSMNSIPGKGTAVQCYFPLAISPE